MEEMALTFNMPMVYTTKAVKSSIVWLLDTESYASVKQEYITETNKKGSAEKTSSSVALTQEASLRRAPLFAKISDSRLAKVITCMSEKKLAEDEILVSQGDEATHLFFLEQGALESRRTFKTGGVDTEDVLKIEPGGILEENALTVGMPIVYTTKALTDSIVWLLEKKEYLILKEEQKEELEDKEEREVSDDEGEVTQQAQDEADDFGRKMVGRRQGVSAETENRDKDWKAPVYPKTEEQLDTLKKVITASHDTKLAMLFGSIEDKDTFQAVMMAMFMKDTVDGEAVITAGAE